MLYLLAAIGAVTIWILPVVYIWCIKPNKSLKDGLKDWLFESSDDI